MPDRKLSPDEVNALGLDDGPATLPARKLSDAETRTLGLETQQAPGGALDSLRAAGRGYAQGLTLGFGDEIGGAEQATLQGAANLAAMARKAKFLQDAGLSNLPADIVEKLGIDARYLDNPLDTYRHARDENRASDAQAQAQHPTAYGVGNVAGAVNGAFALPSVGVAEGATGAGALPALSRIGARAVNGALTAGAYGTLQGVGQSEASDPSRLTGDALRSGALSTALGFGLGAGAGATGEALSGVASRAEQGIAAAEAKAQQMAEKQTEDAISSARGRLGGEVQKGNRLVENLDRLRGQVSPDLQAAIEDYERNGNAQALREKLAESNLRDLPGQADRIDQLRGELDQLQGGKDEAVQQGVDQILGKEGVRNQVMERVKRYGLPMLGSSLGAVVGGPIGAAAGALGGAGMRPAMRSWMNLATKYPGVQRAAWQTVSNIVQTSPETMGRWAPALTRALQGGDDEFAATHYVLTQTDPDYQQHVQQLAAADEQQ